MSEHASEQDLSIEEILSSIRQIISDDDDDEDMDVAASNNSATQNDASKNNEKPEEKPAEPKKEAEAPAAAEEAADIADIDAIMADEQSSPIQDTDSQAAALPADEDDLDDVLELTESVPADLPNADLADDDASDDMADMMEEPETDTLSNDIEAEAEPEPQMAAEPAATPSATPAPSPAQPATDYDQDSLLSQAAEAAALSAFSQLSASGIGIDKSTTLEQIVRELLRPLMREWLDQNLPPIVEKVMREEIQRVAARAR